MILFVYNDMDDPYYDAWYLLVHTYIYAYYVFFCLFPASPVVEGERTFQIPRAMYIIGDSLFRGKGLVMELDEKQNKQEEFSTDLLRVYYGEWCVFFLSVLSLQGIWISLCFSHLFADRLFPYQVIFDWYSYGNDPKNKAAGNSRIFW